MTAIDLNELTAAANRGEKYQHLSPAQAWNAYAYSFTPEQLTDPLPYSLALVFHLAEQKQQAAFNSTSIDPGTMLKAALDEAHPPYIRLPMLARLREGMASFLPGLKASDVNSNLADLASVLGTTEGELLALAEQTGTADQLRDAIGMNP